MEGNESSDHPGPAPAGTEEALGLAADFSAIAHRYDATRALPEKPLAACYDRLLGRGLFPEQGRILDAGCGTGQVSLLLAARGYDVRGVDLSPEMVAIAQSKRRPGWRAEYGTGDVRRLTAADGTFDAVVVSKLFQHIEDWQRACRELIRVARPGSPIVQINERGAFGNEVRRFFSRRADALGFRGRHPGLDPHADEELRAFMMSAGCAAIPLDMSDLRWDVSITYGEAIERIREGLFAEFRRLPRAVHERALADTLAWIAAQPEGRSTIERLRPYLAVALFRTPLRSPAARPAAGAGVPCQPPAIRTMMP